MARPRAVVLHAPVGRAERLGQPARVAATGHGLGRHELAKARGAQGDEHMGRGALHLRSEGEAFTEVALGEGRREIPWLHLGGAGHERAHLALPHPLAGAVGQGDLLQLVVEVHGVLTHELHQSRGRPLGKRDAVGAGHGADALGQLPALGRGAVDDGLGARGGEGLVQPRVPGELLRLAGEHRGGAGSLQVVDELLGVGLFQLVDVAHVDEAHGAGEGHGVAGRGDGGALGRLPVELVGVEGHIAHRAQARLETGDDRLALEGVLSHGQIGGKEIGMLAVAHNPIVPHRPHYPCLCAETVSVSSENATTTSPASSLQ